MWIKFEWMDMNNTIGETKIVQVSMTKKGSLKSPCGAQWRFPTTGWRGGKSRGLEPWGRTGDRAYATLTIKANPDGIPYVTDASWQSRPHVYVRITLEESLNKQLWALMKESCDNLAIDNELRRRRDLRAAYTSELRHEYNLLHSKIAWRLEDINTHAEMMEIADQMWRAKVALDECEAKALRRWPDGVDQSCIGDAGDIGELLLATEEE
jgi:hypothetical protein